MQNYSFKATDDALGFTAMSYSGDEANIVIPDQHCAKPVTILYDRLFAGHEEVTSIRFPDTITDLGEFVFDGCTGLKHIDLPASLKYLWGQTFARCGIEEIVLPDSLGSIPPYAFRDCRNLRKVVCGAGMRRIYKGAFKGCPQLTELICGPDVEITIDENIAPETIRRVRNGE